MRKNTLLYLDSDLVSKAKEADINISKLVEKTLREKLSVTSPKTAHELLEKIFIETAQFGRSFYGEAHLLPFQIQSIRLENVGLFKDFEVCFRENAINVIYGPNASGKSTITRSIILAFGNKGNKFALGENGKITLNLIPDQVSATIASSGELDENMNGYRCLVADEILQCISAEMRDAIFQELAKSKIQAILTTLIPVEQLKLPENSHVIRLETFSQS